MGKNLQVKLKLIATQLKGCLGTFYLSIYINQFKLCVIFFLGILDDNWEFLRDTKTRKKQIWDLISNGLEVAGFTLRGFYQGQTCKNKWRNLRKD